MTGKKKLTYTDIFAGETLHREYENALTYVEGELGQSHPLYIGGKEIFTGNEFEVRSPFNTGILVGKFQNGPVDALNKAVFSAKTGFKSWKQSDWKERTRIIKKTAAILEEETFRIAALITYETGKNRYEAIAEISESVDLLMYYAETFRLHEGFITGMQPESNEAECVSVMKPYGVWVIISPFNFPIALGAGMSAAALITGNTVIMKPASTAPFSTLKLYHAFIEAGVPPDAVHYMTGPGGAFGSRIAEHPDIDGIAFTGSREAGTWLQRTFIAKQPYPKPVISETGSKNPVIVTAYADPDNAADGIIKGAFGFSGQKCSATSRVYVHEQIARDFVKRLTDKTGLLVTGDPRKKDTFISPLISENSLARFLASVEEVKRAGGTVLTGGEVLTNGEFAHGFFVTPAVVTGLPNDHPLVKEELFMPFVILIPFTDLKEALMMANDTEYGLTAGIFSENNEEIDIFFKTIESGVTYANRRGGATTGAWPGSQPFGGWKASGSTGKGAGGPYYLLSYMREQAQTRINGMQDISGS